MQRHTHISLCNLVTVRSLYPSLYIRFLYIYISYSNQLDFWIEGTSTPKTFANVYIVKGRMFSSTYWTRRERNIEKNSPLCSSWSHCPLTFHVKCAWGSTTVHASHVQHNNVLQSSRSNGNASISSNYTTSHTSGILCKPVHVHIGECTKLKKYMYVLPHCLYSLYMCIRMFPHSALMH